MKRQISLALVLALTASLTAGCAGTTSGMQTDGSSNAASGSTSGNTTGSTDVSSSESADASSGETASTETDFSQTDAEMFTDRDLRTEYDEKECIRIQLDNASSTASSDSVQISGSVITITEEATYIISGTLDDGMIIVNADENAKLQLVFDGVGINSETSAALYIVEADKVFVTLAEGTENVLSNGGSFEQIDDNNIDGAVFSKQDLTINGSGALTVTSPAGHGIVSKDDLVITGGTYTIASASHGLQANDSVRIMDAAIAIDAGKDGIHSENDDDASLGFVYISSGTIDIEAEGDGIHSNASITIDGGVFEIATGDDGVHADETLTITACDMNISESYEGLEAKELYISGGDIVINSSDDGLNASGGKDSSGMTGGRDGMFGGGGMGMSSSSDGVIEISGGNITIYASGDGLDSNGTLTISGGYIYVANPTAGDTSVLDADSTLLITGGTFISTGSTTMMAQSFSASSPQGVIACTTGTQPAGSAVTVTDSDGNTLISYETEYNCVLVIISSPDIVKGETYTLTVGDVSGSIEAD